MYNLNILYINCERDFIQFKNIFTPISHLFNPPPPSYDTHTMECMITQVLHFILIHTFSHFQLRLTLLFL